MYVNQLYDYNPWWTDEGSIDEDPQIRAWQRSRLGWDPRAVCKFSPEDYIYSLRGPKQAGKTTLAKLEIQRILKNVPGGNVMYYSFNAKESLMDVLQVIEEYFNHAKQVKDKQRFIFLDEISGITDWQRAIKKLKDMGKLEGCTIIAIGSHTIDIQRAVDRLPGRRGYPENESLDKMILPIKFSQYVCAIDQKIKGKLQKLNLAKNTLNMRDMAQGIIEDEIIEMNTYQDVLNTYLDEYLRTGGTQNAINAYLKNRTIPDRIYDTYLDFTYSQLKDIIRNKSHVNQIIQSIISTMGTPVSLNMIKKHAGIDSSYSVEDTIRALADLFVLSDFYGYEPERKVPKFNARKKIYFCDPLFLHGFNGRGKQGGIFRQSLEYLDDPVHKAGLIEQVTADHAARLAFDMSYRKTDYSYQHSVFYWKGKKGVDFVIRDGDSLVSIDVKYKDKIKRSDLYGTIDFKKTTGTKSSIIITKDTLDIRPEMTMIPASVFLLLV